MSKPVYQRVITDQAVSDNGLKILTYFGLPKGPVPGFPDYVAEGNKSEGLFRADGSDEAWPIGVYNYDYAAAEWKMLAVDGNAVHKTGAETIAGIKTFNSSPVIPDATTSHQAVALGQLSAYELLSNKTATASSSATTYPNWLGINNYAAPKTGGTGYIQNQNSVAQVANAWVQGKVKATQSATDYHTEYGAQIELFKNGVSSGLIYGGISQINYSSSNHSLGALFVSNQYHYVGVKTGNRLVLEDAANTTDLSSYKFLMRATASGNTDAVLGISTLDSRYLLLSGGTLTGDVQQGTAPVNGFSLINKSYVDNLLTGLTWKTEVRVATTANITLSGTQTVDGIALVAGDRVLVKNQTTASQNGIYVVAAGSWTRASDADTTAEIEGATVMIRLGTVNRDTQWTNTNTNEPVIGTDAIAFVQIAGAGTYTNGTGIALSGNVFSLDTTYSDARYYTQAAVTSLLAGYVNITANQTAIAGDKTWLDDASFQGAVGFDANIFGTHWGITAATGNASFGNMQLNTTGNITALQFYDNVRARQIQYDPVTFGDNRLRVNYTDQGTSSTEALAYLSDFADRVTLNTNQTSGTGAPITGYKEFQNKVDFVYNPPAASSGIQAGIGFVSDLTNLSGSARYFQTQYQLQGTPTTTNTLAFSNYINASGAVARIYLSGAAAFNGGASLGGVGEPTSGYILDVTGNTLLKGNIQGNSDNVYNVGSSAVNFATVYTRAITSNGAITFTTPANGIVFMQGAGAGVGSRFSTTNGNLLLNSTTDDGTNKLQVTGGAKVTGTLFGDGGLGTNSAATTTSNFYATGGGGAVTTTAVAGNVFGGASQISFRGGFLGNSTAIIASGNSYANLLVASSPVTTFTSGTHSWLANVVVNPVGTITTAGATVTNTANLYINGVGSGGTNNWALYSTSGPNFFGGTSFFSSGINANFLTASRAVFTDASKNLVSVATTGTGSAVLAVSPILTGTPTAPLILYGTNSDGIVNNTRFEGAITSYGPNVFKITSSRSFNGSDITVGHNSVFDIYVDATGGNVTVTIPTAASLAGVTWYVTKTDGSANTVTLASASTINGGTTLTTQYQSRTIFSSATSTVDASAAYFNH
jgi:hypothetical protein